MRALRAETANLSKYFKNYRNIHLLKSYSTETQKKMLGLKYFSYNIRRQCNVYNYTMSVLLE